MSYILDALKKAERERGLSEVPTIETIHDRPVKRRAGIWVVSGLGVICVAIVFWLLLPITKKSGDGAPSDGAASNSTASDNAPLEADRSLQEEARSIPPAVVPQSPGPASEVPPLMKSPAIHAPATEAAKPVLTEVRAQPPKTETSIRASALQQRELPATERTERSNQTQASGRAAVPPAQVVQSQPESLRDAMAKMTMTIHMYSENKSERLVFINGRKYVEGDQIEPDIRLESITQEGAVLRSGGERLTLRPGSR